ncbi:MAG: hypothetical protein FWG03_06400 [Clostridiales bacterium]|nr:hypothetical protein [Clostridiales bacterium]
MNRLGLAYVVVTSVTRDDLPDGGAAHFAQTIREIRRLSPATKIEVLIPDFGGDKPALGLVIAAGPDVISHNMETVRALYEKVRPQADYDRSLEVLRRIASAADPGAESVAGCTESLAPGAESPAPGEASPKCKSGFMAGVGETDAQVLELMDDLRAAGCTILTIGQYLRPSPDNIPVEAYIAPEVFDRWAAAARERGFEFVASAPFVRSSYHAEEALE